MSDDKQQRVLQLAKSLKGHFGDILRYQEEDNDFERVVIPTQYMVLNKALGGGIPKGIIAEIYGPEHTSKTGLCLGLVAKCQQMGGTAAYIDAEHALTNEYMKLLGVNIPDLLLVRPDFGEQALDIVDALVRSGDIDLVIVDSVAALTPESELEAQMGDMQVGLQARLMSKAMRKLTAVASRHQTAVVFTNQIREKVGVMFGNPEVTPAGRALKFYSSIRIEVRRGAPIKEKDQQIGTHINCRVVKNRIGQPFKRAEFPVYFGRVLDPAEELQLLAMQVLHQAGAWYSLIDPATGKTMKDSEGNEFRYQGKAKVLEALRDNKEFYDEVERRVENDIIAYEVESEEEEAARERKEKRKKKKAASNE